jgi:hypothetical protein
MRLIGNKKRTWLLESVEPPLMAGTIEICDPAEIGVMPGMRK